MGVDWLREVTKPDLYTTAFELVRRTGLLGIAASSAASSGEVASEPGFSSQSDYRSMFNVKQNRELGISRH